MVNSIIRKVPMQPSPCRKIRIVPIFFVFMKGPDSIMFLWSCSRCKSTRSGAHFSLADLDMAMSSGQLVVKKEKTSSSLPIIIAPIDLAVKTPGSNKRKNVGPMDLSLENVRVEDTS